jgi:hypothetical protein
VLLAIPTDYDGEGGIVPLRGKNLGFRAITAAYVTIFKNSVSTAMKT